MNRKLIFVLGSLERGGGQKVVVSLANSFSEKGYNVSIILLLKNENKYQLNKNIKIVDFSANKKPRLLNYFYWRKSLKKYFLDNLGSTIVSFFARINILVLQSAKKENHKIILSERNDPRHDNRGLIGRILAKKLYSKSDLIIFQSKECAKMFPQKVQTKSIVLKNPIEINEIVELNSYDENLLISVGKNSKQKDQLTLIKAMKIVVKAHPEMKLHIFGKGKLRNKLNKAIIKNNLTNNVFLLDPVSNVQESINKSFLFILPSLYEGMSNALLEASLSGVPCITTKCLGTDIISNKENGLFFAFKNYKQLSSQIINLIEDKSSYLSIRENAIRFAKKKPFDDAMKSWEKTLISIIDTK